MQTSEAKCFIFCTCLFVFYFKYVAFVKWFSIFGWPLSYSNDKYTEQRWWEFHHVIHMFNFVTTLYQCHIPWTSVQSSVIKYCSIFTYKCWSNTVQRYWCASLIHQSSLFSLVLKLGTVDQNLKKKSLARISLLYSVPFRKGKGLYLVWALYTAIHTVCYIL